MIRILAIILALLSMGNKAWAYQENLILVPNIEYGQELTTTNQCFLSPDNASSQGAILCPMNVFPGSAKRMFAIGSFPVTSKSNVPTFNYTWATDNPNVYVYNIAIRAASVANGLDLTTDAISALPAQNIALSTLFQDKINKSSGQLTCIYDGATLSTATKTCCTNFSCGGQSIIIIIDDMNFDTSIDSYFRHYGASLTWQ